MIALDTNVLVAAHRKDHPFHDRAFAVVAALAEGHEAWAIPLHTLVEFYGKVTHAKIWKRPSTPKQAWAQIEAWRRSPELRVLSATAATLTQLRSLCETGQITGSQVHDARIAAVCLHHQVRELLSFDRDFSRYPKLETRSPL